jgi:hypothetical protein
LEDESRSARHIQSADRETTKTIKKKSFRQLFSREELWYYGIAALIYIGLGVQVQNWVLNLGISILFIVAWMWIAPPIVAKLKAKRPQSLFYSIFKRSHSVYTGNQNKSTIPTDIASPQNQPDGEAGTSIIHLSTEECAEKVEIE